MTKVKIFKIEHKFNEIEELYNYLLNNIEFIKQTIDIKIQQPLKVRPHCITGCERVTKRNILFFASKSKFIESLGELVTLASVFKSDIVIFFVNDAHKNYIGCLNWLQSICNTDKEFILCEADF